MSHVSPLSGRYWFPLGTRSVYACPQVGDIVALNHQAWRVVEVGDLPVESWRDVDRFAKPGLQKVVRLRPTRLVGHPDPVKAQREDVHYGFAGWWWGACPAALRAAAGWGRRGR